MADIRCPMCGELNPDNLEVCQFCEARLKPLVPPSQPDGSTAQQDAGADLPDWSRLDWQEQDGQDSEEPFSLDDEDPSEWLNRIQASSETDENRLFQPESEELPDEFAESEPEESDWLQRIRNLHHADQEVQSSDTETQNGDELSSPLPLDSTPEDDNLDTYNDEELMQSPHLTIPENISRRAVLKVKQSRTGLMEI